MLTIENDGTSNITLDTFTIAGLPGGVNAVLPEVDGYMLEAGATYNVSFNVSASAATSARTDSLSLQLLRIRPVHFYRLSCRLLIDRLHN